MTVKDPIQIKYYERLLKRKLTERERIGEVPVRYKGAKIYLEINDVVFPYGFMTETQIHSLLGNKGR